MKIYFIQLTQTKEENMGMSKKEFTEHKIAVEETEIRDQMEKALLRAKEDFKK